MKTQLIAAACLCSAAPFAAGQTAYFTQSGVGGNGNPQSAASWNENNTAQSVAFELTFDFTTAVDNETAPIDLWEAGATGNGAALVLRGDELYFFAGNSNTDVVIGDHNLAAGQTDVQVVSVYEINAGGDDTLSIYVNGDQVATGLHDTANAWSGSDAGHVGGNSGNTRYVGYSVFGLGDTVDYPTNDIDFAVYRLASSGGPAENTLANILVPEPSSLALLGMGGLMIARRRR